MIISGWLIATILLILFVPKNKIREAHVSFLFMQALTWVLGLLVVQLKLIQYPIRSFSNATKISFDFEYFIYPAFSALFNLYYPEKKLRLDKAPAIAYLSYCRCFKLICSNY
jgi:hypothetical protein